MSDFSSSHQREEIRRPVRAVIALSAIIFFVEAALMYLMHLLFDPHPFKNMKAFLVEASIDSFFLIILILPAIYFLLYRPLAMELTQRKEYEKALKDSEERFQLLYERAPLPYQSLNPDGTYREVNKAWEQLLGYSREEIIGKSAGIIVDPKYMDVLKSTFPEFLECGRVEGVDYELIRKDGTRVEVTVNGRISHNPDGSIRQTHCILTNVTERRAAERKLKETAEKYQALFTEANDGIVIMDNETGDILECNHEFERQTGRSLAELQQMKIWELRPPEKIETAMAKFHETAETGFGGSSDLEIQKPDGSFTYIDFSTKVLDIADKRFRQSISRDITDRKQYESEIEKREYWLSESQKAAQVGTYYYDIETRFWKSTSVLDELFGIDDTYTKDVEGWLNVIHPEHRQIMSGYLAEIIANKTSFDKEYKIKRVSDGQTRWLYGRGELTIKNDEAVSLIGTIQDITERKAIEGKITKSLREKEVLLREVHHRVKNNMQIINSLMSLQSHHIKDMESREILKECQGRIMSMSLVHEQLYMDDDLGLVNVDRYVKNLIRNIESAFCSSNTGVKYNVNIGVSLDIDTLIPCGLILNELITNSFKYGLSDNNSDEINIQMRPLEDNMLELVYRDSGKGLPDHIDPRKSKGLGLRLVSILTDQLDGQMDVERSSGTRFYFTFPAKVHLSGKS